jgi:hypothetical protein
MSLLDHSEEAARASTIPAIVPDLAAPTNGCKRSRPVSADTAPA